MPATASASLVRMGRVTCIAHAGQLAYPMWRKVKDQIKAVRAQLEDGAQVLPGLRTHPSVGGSTGGGLPRSPAWHAVRPQAATRLQALVDVLTQSFKEGNAGAAQVGAVQLATAAFAVVSHQTIRSCSGLRLDLCGAPP